MCSYTLQQQPFSRMLNMIPGINAAAGLHDYWLNSPHGI